MRIVESQLRLLIREALLTEGMITPTEAVEREVSFVIKKSDDNVMIDALQRGMFHAGEIIAIPVEGIKCRDAWQIRWVQVNMPGLGPLLYDLMMDVVSPRPITADRETVSKYALNVWKYYLKSRPDVESLELDDPLNTRTPPTEDNCYQDSAIEWSKSRWYKSPLARVYRRIDSMTPTLDELTALGLIEFKEG